MIELNESEFSSDIITADDKPGTVKKLNYIIQDPSLENDIDFLDDNLDILIGCAINLKAISLAHRVMPTKSSMDSMNYLVEKMQDAITAIDIKISEVDKKSYAFIAGPKDE